MSENLKTDLQLWLLELAELMESDSSREPQQLLSFVQHPHLAIELMDIIAGFKEEEMDEESSYYSASLLALDMCIAQLKSALETNKSASKILEQLMERIATLINKKERSLSFWLPIMNGFYDAQIELTDELRNAYIDLAYEDSDEFEEYDISDHLESIRSVIKEHPELSNFDLAENFFAQSYAMPADFFSDFIVDFYSIIEAQDVALLTLLHPKEEVRAVASATFNHLIHQIELSSFSLSRLQVIQQWYPKEAQKQFDDWLKIQRKKGVVFQKPSPMTIVEIHATEVDGSGAQGLFIHIKDGRQHRVCGLLFKQEVGIREAWLTPVMSAGRLRKYYKEAFDGSITLRKVNQDYLEEMGNHFLAVTLQKGHLPNLHLLEIQELSGIHFVPQLLNVNEWLQHLSVQIIPFTPDVVAASLKRSKAWVKNKSFTESWFIESANVDKLVNRCSQFIEGAKVCNVHEALDAIFCEEFEPHRGQWIFHFLWMALWALAYPRKNEKLWKDNFLIAYAIHQGMDLKQIPVMHEIGMQTVLNSIDTMQERRTHLN